MDAVNKMIGQYTDESARSWGLFKEMDTNHDGTVDREEFVGACLHGAGLVSHQKLYCLKTFVPQ